MAWKCAFSLSNDFIFPAIFICTSCGCVCDCERWRQKRIMKIVVMTISHWHVTKLIGCHLNTTHIQNVCDCDSACEFFPRPHCFNWIQLMWQEQIKQIISEIWMDQKAATVSMHTILCRQIDHTHIWTLTLSRKKLLLLSRLLSFALYSLISDSHH